MRDLPPRAVLVADDEAILLRLLTRVLERAGYRVLAARDADEALRHVEEEPALFAAILDATLAPTGIDALLDALGGTPGRPGLIVTSGAALPAATRRRLEALGGRFVSKPFAPAALLATLDAVCAGGAA